MTSQTNSKQSIVPRAWVAVLVLLLWACDALPPRLLFCTEATVNDRQLTVLGGQIRSAIAAAEKAGRGFMDAAYVAGEKLLKAKENVKRGEWQAWVQEHAGIELRAAQRYMRIASRWEELEDESSMTKALEGISVKVKNVTRVAKPPKSSNAAAGDSQAVCSPPRAEGEHDEAPSVPVQDVPTDGDAGTEATYEQFEAMWGRMARGTRVRVMGFCGRAWSDVELPFVSEEFAAAWGAWEQYRKEDKRNALKDRSRRLQIKKLTGWGEKRAIAAIEHSIAQGFTGIYEPSERNGSARQSRTKAAIDKAMGR